MGGGGPFELINEKKKKKTIWVLFSLGVFFGCGFVFCFFFVFFIFPACNARREEDERGSVQEEQSCNI